MIKTIHRGLQVISKEHINIVIRGLFVCIFAFIISRGSIMGYSPMTVACYVSVINQRKIRFLVLLSLMGGLITNSGENTIKYLLILVILSTFIYMFEFFKLKINNLLIISMITTFVITYALPAYLNNNPYGLAGAIIEAVCVVILSLFFRSGLNGMVQEQKDNYIEVAISASVITFAIIIGVYGVKFISLPMVNIIVLTLLIQIGYQYGIEVSALFSMGVGFAFSYIYKDLEFFVIYIIIGIISGVFRKLDKVGCLIASLLAYVGLWNLYGQGDALELAKLLIIVSCIYMLIPSKAVKEESDQVVDVETHILKEKLDKFAFCYANLAKMFTNISIRKDQISKEEIDELIDDVASRVCLSCSMCEICWKKKFYQTYRTVYSVLAELEVKGQVYVNDIPKAFYDDCIKSDEFIRMINKIFELYKTNLKWENKLNDCRELFAEQFNNVATTIIDLSDHMLTYRKTDDTYANRLKRFLIKNGVKVEKVSIYSDVHDKRRIVINTPDHNINITSFLKKINHIMVDQFRIESKKENTHNYEYILVEKEKYKIIKGVAKRSRGEVAVSGDNFTFINLNSGKEIIAISDGMGSGIKAFEDSETAIEILEQLTEGGFDLQTILKTINALLGVKNNHESFATMDVSMVDKYSGDCTIIKNGAVSTFIKSGKLVETITGEALPFGIVKNVQYKSIIKQLKKDDLIIMVSDGVIENRKDDLNGEMVLIDYLETCNILNPQKIASDIIDMARKNYAKEYDDDMTAIVLRILETN